MKSTPVLRDAVAEDEAFVLGLEELSLRRLSETNHGRFMPRPGMGDGFPANCRIIQYQSKDVGRVTVTDEERFAQIEQFCIAADAQRNGIGRQVAESVISQAANRRKHVQVTLPAYREAEGFSRHSAFA